jgi:hypothetical protein
LEFKAFGVGAFLKGRRNWFLPRKSRNMAAPRTGDEFRKAVLPARKRTDEIELQDAVGVARKVEDDRAVLFALDSGRETAS